VWLLFSLVLFIFVIHKLFFCFNILFNCDICFQGAAAVWPRCYQKQSGGAGGEDKVCGEPLLAPASKGSCGHSRGGGNCLNPSSWRCHRHGHDEICSSCLVRQQELLVGSGPSASTDIYDAIVDRETTRREGAVFLLSGLQSRKPPRIEPNWRTTYRLQTSALVAVVKLGVSQQKLSRDKSIQWAEIVNYNQRAPGQGGFKGDWESRQQGHVALRLLTRYLLQ
jgi:hypothetical protein